MNGGENMKSLYPGIALIGGENTAGIYSVNGGIVDAQGVGIQHLFYKTYEQDLIHTACTLDKIKESYTMVTGSMKQKHILFIVILKKVVQKRIYVL